MSRGARGLLGKTHKAVITTGGTTMTATATEVRKCAKPYDRKVKGGVTKTYKCDKPTGHEGPHGRVMARKEISIPLVHLDSYETVPNTEFVPLAGRERDTQQVKVDAHVRQLHQDWTDAGKPSKPTEGPRGRYLVPADQVDGIRTLLRRAGDFTGYRVQVAPAVRHTSGNMSIQFRVTDRKRDARPSEIRAGQ